MYSKLRVAWGKTSRVVKTSPVLKLLLFVSLSGAIDSLFIQSGITIKSHSDIIFRFCQHFIVKTRFFSIFYNIVITLNDLFSHIKNVLSEIEMAVRLLPLFQISKIVLASDNTVVKFFVLIKVHVTYIGVKRPRAKRPRDVLPQRTYLVMFTVKLRGRFAPVVGQNVPYFSLFHIVCSVSFWFLRQVANHECYPNDTIYISYLIYRYSRWAFFLRWAVLPQPRGRFAPAVGQNVP